VDPVRIPGRLARASVAWEGERARAWLADLPRLVAELEAAWDLRVGPAYEPGGSVSWVAPVRRRNGGAEAVLKVQLPHAESAPEAMALAAWDGAGAVRLLAHDPTRSALLVERCDPGRALVDDGGMPAAVAAGARVGARLHAVPPPAGLATLASVLEPWADAVEEQVAAHGAWLDGAIVAAGLATMRSSATGARGEPVFLHGDLNPTNVLAAARLPWLAIDPKPMVGDAAYDGARLVLQPDPLATADPVRMLDARLDLVADGMRVDRDRLTRWCLADALQMAVGARHHGDDVGARRSAAHLALVAPLLG
jgi:streptomycin 6-kinase